MILAPSFTYQQVTTIRGWKGTDSDFNSESIFFTLPVDGVKETAMFDTGSFSLMLPASLGKKLHLPVIGLTSIGGIVGNEVPAYWSKVDIQLGTQTFKGVWCTVGGDGPILFGMEFFRDNGLSFTIDPYRNEIDVFKRAEISKSPSIPKLP